MLPEHVIRCAPVTCLWCGASAAYSLTHMAAYCEKCDVWLQLRCPDWDCPRCRDRPVVPSKREELDELRIGPG